jgi:hypothetical protein
VARLLRSRKSASNKNENDGVRLSTHFDLTGWSRWRSVAVLTKKGGECRLLVGWEDEDKEDDESGRKKAPNQLL